MPARPASSPALAIPAPGEALIFPCAVVAVSLATPPSPLFALSALLAAGAACATAIVLKTSRSSLSAASRAASLLALGLSIAGLIAWKGIAEEAARHWGIPPVRITSIEARLTRDPTPLAGDRALLDLELISARDADGREAESRGSFALMALGARTAPSLAEGSRIRAALRLSPSAADRRLATVDAQSIEKLDAGDTGEALRADARSAILRLASRAGETEGLIAALALGERSNLDGELKDSFARAGCIHILALSGMHLSLVAFALGAILRPPLGARLAALVSVALLFSYSYLTGMGASIMRSFAMYGIAFSLGLIGAERDAKRTLCIAFLMLAALDPPMARTLSFRLSFLAMGGIAFWSRPLATLLGKKLPRALAGPLAQGLAAQLAVSPVLCIEFATLNAASVPASLLLAPLALVFMGAGMVYLVLAALGFAPWLTNALAWALSTIEAVIKATLSLFGGFPSLILRDEASRWAALACLVLFGLFLYRCHAHDGLPRLRFAALNKGLARFSRHERAKALRAEFPRK